MAKMSKKQESVNTILSIENENSEIKNVEKVESIITSGNSYITNEELKLPDSNCSFFRVNNIPSNYAFYPSERIFIKSYSWGQTISYPNNKLDTIALWNLILDGIYTEGFDKEDLTLQDFLFLSTFRRLKTVGNSKFTTSSICKNIVEIKDDKGLIQYKECGYMNNFVLSDNSNCITYESLEFKKGEVLEIKVKNEWETFTPLTIKDSKFLLMNNLLDDKIAKTAKQCRTKPFEDIYDILKSDDFDFREGQYLDQIPYKFFHGLNPVEKDELGRELKCKDCGQNVSVELDGGGIIIQPFHESEPETNRIRVNVKS